MFSSLNPVAQALIATIATWLFTALGAAVVFVFRSIRREVLDGLLGFAGGVMIAASFWSLLQPAIEMASRSSVSPIIPVVAGFLAGGAFLRLADCLLPHLHARSSGGHPEGIPTGWRKSLLLVLAVTLHNIPEGLALGVAFGAVGARLESASLVGAIGLMIGLGLQNIPEGVCVAVPLYREGLSKWKCFLYGQFSGMVEPVAAVIGAASVLAIQSILPYALAFAAGAMIFVVVEEAIPESQGSGNTHIATTGTMLGFAVMMMLEIGLG